MEVLLRRKYLFMPADSHGCCLTQPSLEESLHSGIFAAGTEINIDYSSVDLVSKRYVSKFFAALAFSPAGLQLRRPTWDP